MKAASITERFNALSVARKTLLAAGAIFVLTLAAYSNSFNAGFHFDDSHQILKNRNIRTVENLPRFFVDADMGSSRAGIKGYRPVTLSSLAVNYALSGYSVFGYHLVNFLIHFLNAFLVFLITRLVLNKAGEKDASLLPLVISLIFALHPIQTNAVTYITGRAALLSAMFCLLALYAFVSYRTGSGARVYVWAAAAPVFFLAGLLSKETAVGVMALFAAYDVIFTLPGRGGSGRPFKGWVYYLPFLAVFAFFLFYRMYLVGFAATGQSDHTPAEYMLSEAKTLLLYLRLMALPMNQNADYNLPATVSVDSLVALSGALVLSALVFICRLRKKNPAAAFFGLWFFLALAPESSVIPIEDIAVEYRMYLPSVGLIAVLVLVLAGHLKNAAFRRGLAVPVLVLLGILTFNRNLVWATDYTLWADVVKKAPYSFRAHANFGSALIDSRQYKRAMEELQVSLGFNEFYTESFVLYNNLGLCYSEMGMPEKAEEEYRLATRVYPQEVSAYRNLGGLYYGLRRYREAVDILRQAVMIDPEDGQSHFILAKAFSKTGRSKEAQGEMERALVLMPGSFFVNYDLAVIYKQNGMLDKALGQARASLAIAPEGPMKGQAEAFAEGLEKGR